MSDLQRRAVEEFVPRWLELHRLAGATSEEDFRRKAETLAMFNEGQEFLAYYGMVNRLAFTKAADAFVTDAGAWADQAVAEYRVTRDEALRASYDVTFGRVNFLRSIGFKGAATRTFGSGTLADDLPDPITIKWGIVIVVVIVLALAFRGR